MSKPVAALLLFVAAPAAAAGPAALPTRLSIPTFIVANDPGVSQDLQTWTNLLQSDETALAGQLPMLRDVGRIKFTELMQTSAPTLSTIDARWRQLNALQVITAIGLKGSGGTSFEGSIYLGSLGSRIPASMLPLPPSIRASDYQTSRDTVKAATMFALAVDAGSDKAIACPLLERAALSEHDLAKKGKSPGGLAAAIKQQRASVGCTPAR